MLLLAAHISALQCKTPSKLTVSSPTPGASFTYGLEKQTAYADSTNAAVAAQTVESGRISVDPKFILDAIETGPGSFSPWVSARY